LNVCIFVKKYDCTIKLALDKLFYGEWGGNFTPAHFIAGDDFVQFSEVEE
jgi:hypothetical protein